MDSDTTAGGVDPFQPLDAATASALQDVLTWAFFGCFIIGVVVLLAMVISCVCGPKEGLEQAAAFPGGRAPQQQQPAAPAVEAVVIQVAGEDDAAVQAAPPGLDLEPVLECTFRTADGWEETMCSVCLSEMADGEAVRVLMVCMHCFHTTCVEQWLRDHATCPLCRAPTGAALAKGAVTGRPMT